MDKNQFKLLAERVRTALDENLTEWESRQQNLKGALGHVRRYLAEVERLAPLTFRADETRAGNPCLVVGDKRAFQGLLIASPSRDAFVLFTAAYFVNGAEVKKARIATARPVAHEISNEYREAVAAFMSEVEVHLGNPGGSQEVEPDDQP